MKWLTIDKIKAQCRIEASFTDENEYLEDLGDVAEEAVLTYCDRTYEDFYEQYGKIPAMVHNASLLLVDLWYQRRTPAENATFSSVPYGNIDFMLKPYMRLADRNENQNDNDNGKRYGCKNL